MLSYLDIITTISSILLIRINTPESLEKKRELLNYIRQKDKKVYRKLRYGLLGNCMNHLEKPEDGFLWKATKSARSFLASI